MAILNIRKYLLSIILATILAGAIPKTVMAQNCNCGPNLCCSKYRYCGLGDAYCGDGCLEGRCDGPTQPPPGPPSPCKCAPDLCLSQYGYYGTGPDYCGVGCQCGRCYPPPPPPTPFIISDIVTQEFFDGIINQASASCPGKGFYTRATFLAATKFYPLFGRVGTEHDSKREIAAFFAHVTHETGHFCYIEERVGAAHNYCDSASTMYPCVPGKQYTGRGPLQLTWNYNYGSAGDNIGFDGLKYPHVVAVDPIVSFRTAIWFWVNRVQPVMKQGFGATIRAIDSVECNGGNPDAVRARVQYYTDYCKQFSVVPGDNLCS